MNGAAVSDAAHGVPATSVIVREWNEWEAGLPDWLRVVRALDEDIWELVASTTAATATPVLEALERFWPAGFFEVVPEKYLKASFNTEFLSCLSSAVLGMLMYNLLFLLHCLNASNCAIFSVLLSSLSCLLCNNALRRISGKCRQVTTHARPSATRPQCIIPHLTSHSYWTTFG